MVASYTLDLEKCNGFQKDTGLGAEYRNVVEDIYKHISICMGHLKCDIILTVSVWLFMWLLISTKK